MALIGPFSVGYPVNFTSGGDTTRDAFGKHIQEIERIYGYLNALDAGKVSASDVSGLSGSIGSVNTALTNHINSSNPHPNYKPSVSWSDLTNKPNLADLNGNLPVSRITGLPSTSDTGDGITDSSLSNNGYVKFNNGLIINWGRLTLNQSNFASAASRYGEDDYAITFAKAFTLACYIVTVGTEIDTTDNEHAEVVFQTKAKTITGCKIVPQLFYGSTSGFRDWNSIHANYIAIGV